MGLDKVYMKKIKYSIEENHYVFTHMDNWYSYKTIEQSMVYISNTRLMMKPNARVLKFI